MRNLPDSVTAPVSSGENTRGAQRCDWQTCCAAVIPCLNEEKTIREIVGSVRRYVNTVVVVDDGSTDLTAAHALEAGATVLTHETALGKGAALRSGWVWAAEHGYAWALSLDGDGQHSPEDIPRFFRRAEASLPALVVGNRMDNPGPMPAIRRFVNRWLSERISRVARRSFPDSQCGFRLMNLQAWSGLDTTTAHFEIESEVLLAFAAANKPVEFVPVQALYKDEQSKIHPLCDTIRWFRWWRRARARCNRAESIGIPPLAPRGVSQTRSLKS